LPHLSAQINTTYFINRINNLFCKDMKNIPLSDICYPKYPSLKQLFRIMRISIFLLFFSVLGMMAESGHSQNARVTINRNNVQLESILNDIESQTDYLFLYKGNLDVTVRKSIHVSDKTVTEVLSTLLSKSPITYEIEGNHIILVERKEQEIHQNIVSGIVTDASGEPLVGVTVLIKGATQGAVTDLNGKFSLTADAGDILVVRYIGYVPQEIKIGNTTELVQITLEEDITLLDEVVVVGYGTQKKVNLTGSVSSISSKELVSKPVAFTSQAIAGLSPGMSVLQTSGRPGTGASVRIRGTGTFSSAGTDPLVLIDGLAGSLDDVNPNDIQSISILKDAASASIYGNRAANGVILIETKKGSSGKISVSYNNSFGWQRPTATPEFLSSAEYATYYNEAQRNMGNNEVYTVEQIQKYKDGSDPDKYPNVNHLDWLLNSGSGFQHRHTVSIQGGNDKLSYNLSLGYMGQDGITAKTNNTRYTGLFTMKSVLTEGLTFNMSLNAYANNYKAPNSSERDINGIIGFSVREGPIYAGRKSDGTFGYQDNYSPEAWLASESFYQSLSSNIAASGQLTWDTPIEGFSLSGKMGLNYYTGYYKSFWAETVFDENKTVGPATLDITSENNLYKIFELLARYNKNLGKHQIGFLAGSSIEEANNRSLNGGRNTFPNNNLYELEAGSASTSSNGSNWNSYALASFFGRVNYSWNDRYLLEANVRYDGSSRFAKKNRWGLFPSISAGWRISEEAFWSKYKDVVENLKLRVSWGKLGNQNIGYYPYQQVYSTIACEYPFGYPGVLQPGVRNITYNNRDITWETTAVTDIGLDFGIFNGTLTGSIDYFYKYTSDILSSVEKTNILGRGVGESNVGAVSNRGIEVMLTYNGKIGREFRFSISPNFTYVKNAVEKLADGKTEQINNARIVGEPLGIIYGYQTDGLFVDQAEIDAAPEQLVSKTNIKPGYVKYKDISGPDGVPDGKVDANYDRCILGTTTPKFYYGLNINATYKGFDFSALLQGLGGHHRLIGSYMAYAFYNGGQIQKWQVENRWTAENPNKWAEYPRLETLNGGDPNLQTSDYWVRNASFLRIKNVQLGYSLPRSVISKIGLSAARIYVSCENLHNFTSFYTGWDPENEIGTGDSPSYYPINRIYSFGLSLNF
jgi:TonB-linked SusC/RagA family outer membrane protein